MADADINSDLKYEESTTLVQKKLKYDTILSTMNYHWLKNQNSNSGKNQWFVML